ncbi:MAG: fibronectin type III domain-containing protein [Eubacterium sp.]|nr:fibronectin type III domain-containing protein [Eubacterium sp.]
MKKTLSVIFAIILTLGCFNIGAVNALAYTDEKAPEIKLGDTFRVSAPVNEDKDVTNACFARFTPKTTGYYEFIVEKGFTAKNVGEALVTAVCDKDDVINSGKCAVLSDEYKELGEQAGVTNNPSVACRLKKGHEYYFKVVNVTNKRYVSDVKLRKHTHKTKKTTKKSFVDAKSMKNNVSGKQYSVCTKNNCTYKSKKTTIYRVKSIKLSKTKYVYNGKKKKPVITVKTVKGKKLKKGTDYKVTYKNNKQIGKATATIRFIGKYRGTVIRNFKVIPRKTSLTSVNSVWRGFTANWKKQKTNITGYQLQYSTDKHFKKGVKRITVSKADRTYKTVRNLKRGKKYYVRIRTYQKVDNKKFYSNWSKYKPVKVK